MAEDPNFRTGFVQITLEGPLDKRRLAVRAAKVSIEGNRTLFDPMTFPSYHELQSNESDATVYVEPRGRTTRAHRSNPSPTDLVVQELAEKLRGEGLWREDLQLFTHGLSDTTEPNFRIYYFTPTEPFQKKPRLVIELSEDTVTSPSSAATTIG